VRFTKNIFLVGMPGSGKSTVGRLLAEKLALDFYDLDAEIEATQGKTIAEIFAEGDEELFRKVESSTLLETIANKKTFVMAAGGGTACFFDGMKIMSDSGVTVYLDTPIEVLIARTKRKQHRPLLKANPISALKDLLNKREKCYAQANYRIDTRGLELQGKVEKIIGLLPPSIKN
jgi:shikimate kinase